MYTGNLFFFPSGGGPPKTNATIEKKAMTAERSRAPLGNPLFWMRKVMANGNTRPANLWLVATHAGQSYLEDAKCILTLPIGAPADVMTTAKYLLLGNHWLYQQKHNVAKSTWHYLNGDIRAMHKEAGHHNTSHQALSQGKLGGNSLGCQDPHHS